MALSTSQKPPGLPGPTVRPPNPVRDAARARQRARFMEEQRRNAEARRAGLGGGDPMDDRGFGKPAAQLGGEDVGGGQVFGGEGNPKVRSAAAFNRGDTPYSGPGAQFGVQPAPVTADGQVPTNTVQRENRHLNRNRQQPAGQITQEAAQALYNDNTIPHEFKGQLMELARSGNAQSFAQTLFGSGLPQETKLRLMQLFGFGGSSGVGNPQPHPQGAPQPAPQNPDPVVPTNPAGSPYYGAY